MTISSKKLPRNTFTVWRPPRRGSQRTSEETMYGGRGNGEIGHALVADLAVAQLDVHGKRALLQGLDLGRDAVQVALETAKHLFHGGQDLVTGLYKKSNKIPCAGAADPRQRSATMDVHACPYGKGLAWICECRASSCGLWLMSEAVGRVRTPGSKSQHGPCRAGQRVAARQTHSRPQRRARLAPARARWSWRTRAGPAPAFA